MDVSVIQTGILDSTTPYYVVGGTVLVVLAGMWGFRQLKSLLGGSDSCSIESRASDMAVDKFYDRHQHLYDPRSLDDSLAQTDHFNSVYDDYYRESLEELRGE
nr:major capsid protein [uncultured Desulfuromonas sp.]